MNEECFGNEITLVVCGTCEKSCTKFQVLLATCCLL